MLSCAGAALYITCSLSRYLKFCIFITIFGISVTCWVLTATATVCYLFAITTGYLQMQNLACHEASIRTLLIRRLNTVETIPYNNLINLEGCYEKQFK